MEYPAVPAAVDIEDRECVSCGGGGRPLAALDGLQHALTGHPEPVGRFLCTETSGGSHDIGETIEIGRSEHPQRPSRPLIRPSTASAVAVTWTESFPARRGSLAELENVVVSFPSWLTIGWPFFKCELRIPPPSRL
ncbi:hypothetical protein JWS13_32760 [Rhodococcus pseudokoreensis]|uniref:Uncharacterized protein n=1 Tax=Rhodococcus pseudokoreensis TaxID=2811421 RepID=A0A974W840_9NOCA|nr:hypothetical protein [Rhodococcus pseudokoreensis]QSE93023.1 hypothetical protein JWS13_32760 [Rhodococcus pseudokoreensis]